MSKQDNRGAAGSREQMNAEKFMGTESSRCAGTAVTGNNPAGAALLLKEVL